MITLNETPESSLSIVDALTCGALRRDPNVPVIKAYQEPLRTVPIRLTKAAIELLECAAMKKFVEKKGWGRGSYRTKEEWEDRIIRYARKQTAEGFTVAQLARNTGMSCANAYLYMSRMVKQGRFIRIPGSTQTKGRYCIA